MKSLGNMAWKTIVFMIPVLLFSWCFNGVSTISQEPSPHSLAPILKDGQKWRAGYVETEPYANYAAPFYALVRGLEKNGWLANVHGLPYRSGQTDSKGMWEWLARRDTGSYIQFVADAHFSLRDGTAVAEELRRRLTLRKDLDLLIVMGTGAGVFLSRLDYNIPTMVFSSTNAVLSGIIRSETDSGADHLWAHIDPGLYRRQVEVFHDLWVSANWASCIPTIRWRGPFRPSMM